MPVSSASSRAAASSSSSPARTKPPREGELPAEGFDQSVNEQDIEHAVTHGEGDDVDCYRKARGRGKRFGHGAILGTYRHLDNKACTALLLVIVILTRK
jgi:hypothetical protein